MRQSLAQLLRRLADRLDPPPVAQGGGPANPTTPV